MEDAFLRDREADEAEAPKPSESKPAETKPGPEAAKPRKARPKRRIGRWLLILALIAAGAALAAWRLGWFAEEAPSYLTAPARRGDIEETVLATGVVKPSKLVAAGAQASGRILSVDVALGQKVKAGDQIAQIDSVTQENALRTAGASLAQIRAQRVEKEALLVQAELTLARQQRMAARNAVAQSELEAAEADAKSIRAQIDALDAQIEEAEVAVETAKANLGYTKITAPIDGTVLAIVTQAGTTVNASQSTPTIAVLGQLDVMTVRAEISEADIVKVAPGQPIWFTVLGAPERRFEATLGSIEPAPESITNDSALGSSSASSSSTEAIYYIGVFDADNADGTLRTYMTAEVHIVLGRAENALLIPASALGRRGKDGRASVRVLKPDGQVERRKIKTGLTDKIDVEVLDGLEEGERVVTGSRAASGSGSGNGSGRRSTRIRF